jgi:hypothetical protein
MGRRVSDYDSVVVQLRELAILAPSDVTAIQAIISATLTHRRAERPPKRVRSNVFAIIPKRQVG